MTVDPSLIAAYRSAHYWVEVDGKRIELRVGEHVPALDEALTRRSVTTWALLTAHNPRSQRRSDAENAEAQRALEKELTSIEYELLPAHGGAEYGWSEASVVALNVNETEARRLMRAYGQNGCLFGYAGGPVALRISKPAKALTEAELSILVVALRLALLATGLDCSSFIDDGSMSLASRIARVDGALVVLDATARGGRLVLVKR